MHNSPSHLILYFNHHHAVQTSTQLFVIVYADKSHLSSFETAKGSPVIACLANLPDHFWNGEDVGGGKIVGWLFIQLSITGQSHRCLDEIVRLLVPIILILSADYEEQ